MDSIPHSYYHTDTDSAEETQSPCTGDSEPLQRPLSSANDMHAYIYMYSVTLTVMFFICTAINKYFIF